MHFPDRTLIDLGYHEIRQALAARCRTEPGKDRALGRPFLSTASSVLEQLALVAEGRQLLAEPLNLPLGGVSNIEPLLARATKGGMLEPEELVRVTHVLFAFERVREALDDRRERLPRLAAISRRIPGLERLATRLDRCFEPSGEISDRASPALKEARDHTRGLHRTIKGRIDKLLHDEKFAVNLRDQYFSVRHDRYVFPVQAQHRSQVPGIVHNASQSGQTLFIEPQELIGLGNELAIAQSLVLEEERRVLQELSSAVGRESTAIEEGVHAAAELDEIEAAARLANELDASNPELEVGEGSLSLLELRHPLLVLQGGQVVANDVQLSSGVRGLVVSGPNAGGKTVTITAVGLCALMLRAGLPIPASPGSRLPLFSSIHSAVGDAQDLAQGLSTFSAHVKELKDITAAAENGSLVLIDEIAADTDPKEGAALATSVLEDLVERGAIVLVTTHLEELKALAHLDRRFVNARVGFDPRKMAPTFRLQLGAAGTSSAIEIAARMGLSNRVIDRARELLRGAGGPLAQALMAAEDERRTLVELQAKADQATRDAEQTTRQYQQRLEALEEQRRTEEVRFREALTAELAFAQAQVKELLAALRKQASQEALEKSKRELEQRVEEQRQALELLQRTKEKPAPAPTGPYQLRVGGWVRHLKLDREVEVLELHDGVAVVAAGPMRLRAALEDLGPARSARPAARFPTSEKTGQRLDRAREAAPQALAVGGATCDVRGLRADEALRNVEQFLDRLTQQGESVAVILHGHGTGALKQSVREYLQHCPYVQSFRRGESQEGGDGVTLIELRG